MRWRLCRSGGTELKENDAHPMLMRQMRKPSSIVEEAMSPCMRRASGHGTRTALDRLARRRPSAAAAALYPAAALADRWAAALAAHAAAVAARLSARVARRARRACCSFLRVHPRQPGH